MPRLSLCFLGPFQAMLDDRSLTGLASTKVRALLAYLAVESDRPHARETLAGMLWPDVPNSNALRNLRLALSNLRLVLGDRSASPSYLLISRETIQFNPASDHELDVAAWTLSTAIKDDAKERVAAVRGSFLDGFSCDSAPFEEWLRLRREQINRNVISALRDLTAQCETLGDYAGAQTFARRQLDIDPWDEAAHRQLMRALAAGGQTTAALAQYQACSRLLKQELGAEPSPETTALYESIRRGAFGSESRRVISNVPRSLTSFIGREREIDEVRRLLESTRLLTFTGSGGCGKTRLALQVAPELADEYAHGAWFVDLAPLSDPTLVLSAIGSVFDVRESKDASLTSILTNYLHAKHILLVLDNCEHLIEACAQVVDLLLHACPRLTILATSRQVLGIAGETAFRVPSLAFPDLPSVPMEALSKYEAIRLFVERATASKHDFLLTKTNAPMVGRICQRLDGMPLAIELAAARVRSLSVEQIALRLDDRFRLLTVASRTAPTRQQTLREAIDWSYDLLTEQEQALWQRLSVFAAGWTVEAAEAVCSGEGLPASDILDLLAHLVDKSVVVAPGDAGRYYLLETIRQYGHEKLVQASGLEKARSRHLEYFLKLAEEAEPKLKGPEQSVGLDRLEREYANLRVAWDWAIETDVEIALRLAWALFEFWRIGAHLPEARHWLERLVPYTEGWGVSPKRALALTVAGALASLQRDYLISCELIEQGLAIAQETTSRFEIAFASEWLGFSTFFLGKFQTARASLETSLVLWRELGNELYVARAQFFLAMVTRDQGQFELAEELFETSLGKFRMLGNNRYVASVLNSMGESARLQGDYERAAKLYEECVRQERADGRKFILALATGNMGTVSFRAGDYQKARTYYEESLALGRELGGPKDMTCLNLVGLAGLMGATGKPEHAARLLGLVEATIHNSSIVLQPADRIEYDYVWERVRTQLDEKAFEQAQAKGRVMTLDQAVEFALAESIPVPESRVPFASHGPNALTPRELEVLRLVADGLSDAQVAEKLVISIRTVNSHLSSIYSKLRIQSRSAATRYALDHKLV